MKGEVGRKRQIPFLLALVSIVLKYPCRLLGCFKALEYLNRCYYFNSKYAIRKLIYIPTFKGAHHAWITIRSNLHTRCQQQHRILAGWLQIIGQGTLSQLYMVTVTLRFPVNPDPTDSWTWDKVEKRDKWNVSDGPSESYQS